MLKISAMAATATMLTLTLSTPVSAYDPCQRATRDFGQADRAYTDYCGLTRGQAPYDSYTCARRGESDSGEECFEAGITASPAQPAWISSCRGNLVPSKGTLLAAGIASNATRLIAAIAFGSTKAVSLQAADAVDKVRI